MNSTSQNTPPVDLPTSPDQLYARLEELGIPFQSYEHSPVFTVEESKALPVQLPGGQGDASGGQREFVPVLARAAVGAGVAGLFMETHPDPDRALSDGPNAWPLDDMPALLETLLALDQTVKSRGLVGSAD